MDVNGSKNVIDINYLRNWQDMLIEIDNRQPELISEPVFKVSSEINQKLFLWNGNIFKLRTEAIVIPINNFIDDKLTVESSVIYKLAGNRYGKSFINLVLGCKTSEIRVTEGFNLPCYYVFHTVCPRYNPKYESAAINAIYNCYRNSLLAAMDRKIKRIGFATLHISKYSFPDDIGIHIAARTIRRFLEKFSEYIDEIVLEVPHNIFNLYQKIFPIYFPRNRVEENYSVLNTPADLGNEDGQPVQPDREIRISAFPYGPRKSSVNSSDSEDDEEILQGLNDISFSSCSYISQSHVPPAVLRQSINVKSEGRMVESIKTYEEIVAVERRFERLLRNSKKMDLTNLTQLRVFYQCGKDIQDEPILLVVEKNIPTDIDSRKNEIFSFIISTLEKLVKGKNFSIVYAHTLSTYRPSREFVTEIYSILKTRYSKFLKCICMVHPSLVNRGINWIFTTFNAPELKSKLYNVTNLRQLYRIVNPNVLELPDFIYQYDKQIGGTNVNSNFVVKRVSVEESRRSVKLSLPSTGNEEL